MNIGYALALAGILAAHKGKTLPRWACASCGLFYGKPGRTKYGFCTLCWDVWLAECRLSTARAQLAWQQQRMARFVEMGEVPQ